MTPEPLDRPRHVEAIATLPAGYDEFDAEPAHRGILLTNAPHAPFAGRLRSAAPFSNPVLSGCGNK